MKSARKILNDKEIRIEGLPIRTKLILSILPVVLLSLVALTYITTLLNQRVILSKSNEEMTAILSDYASRVEGDIDTLCTETSDLAKFVGSTYSTTDIDSYADAITRILKTNNMILGSGLWFEPNIYDHSSRYYGPYWYKSLSDKGVWDDGKIEKTLEYSNATYDYFNQVYYKTAKSTEIGTTYLTEPYYDETTGFVMVTCSSPIYSKDNKFIGCVTIDIMCDYIDTFFDSIRIGNTGRMLLLDGNYNYLYHPDYEKVVKQGITLHDTKEIGTEIENKDRGEILVNIDKEPTLLYWMKVPNTTWKIGLLIDRAEVLADSEELIVAGFVTCIISVIVCAIIIFVHAYYFTRAAKSIAESLNDLSEGDFHKINKYANRRDEYGVMINSTNLLVEKLFATTDAINKVMQTVVDATDGLSNEYVTLAETSTDVENISNEVAKGITTRREQAQLILNKFEDLSINLDTLIDITQQAQESVVEDTKVDTKGFKEVREGIAELITVITDIVEKVRISNESFVEIQEKLDTLTYNAKQTNMLAVKSSAKVARFGDFGTTTVKLIDEIVDVANASADVAYQTKDKLYDIKHEVEDLNNQLQTLTQRSNDINITLVNLPEPVKERNNSQDTERETTIIQLIQECDKTRLELQRDIVTLKTLYDDNEDVMLKSGNIVERLNEAVEILEGNTDNLNESLRNLETQLKFFKH